MIQNQEELAYLLHSIKFAIRATPGRPAEFLPESRASKALSKLLREFSPVLQATFRNKATNSGRRGRLPDSGEIINSALLYAVQPPIVKDIDKSTRKEKLRLQALLDWLVEEHPTLDSFTERFCTWANIFATEYFHLCDRQNTDTPVMEWKDRDKSVVLAQEEEYQRRLSEVQCSNNEECNPWAEMDTTVSPENQIKAVLVYLRESLAIDDENRRMAAVFIFRNHLLLEFLPGFPEIRRQVLDYCSSWAGKECNEIEKEVDSECERLRERLDLTKRRVQKDLPKLNYPFILPLIGEDIHQKGRYYTALHRFEKNLRQYILSAEQIASAKVKKDS